MSTRVKWSMVWGAWVGYFAIAEYIALRTEHGDAPLSAHMRYALQVKRPRPYRSVGQLVFVAGVAWLADHMYRGVMHV